MFTRTELFPEILYQSRVELTPQQYETLWDVCEIPLWIDTKPFPDLTGPSNIYHYSNSPDYRGSLVQRLPELIMELMGHARTYMEECIGAPLIKDDQLVMKYIKCALIPSGGAVPNHTHFYNGSSFLSGTVCLADGGGNTVLAIQGPRYSTTEPLITKYTPNTNEHYVYPKRGDVFMWQSHLSHGVPLNTAPGPMLFLWFDVDYIHGHYPIPECCIVRGS